MKKFILVLFVLAAFGGSLFAFDLLQYPPSLDGGDLLIDIGAGFGSFGASNWDVKIPPLAVSVEFCIPAGIPLSIGGMFSFFQYGWESSSHSWTYDFMVFAGRANWHWNFDVSLLDFYTGISLGYQSFSSAYSGPDQAWANTQYNWNYGGFFWAGQLGAHFYFTKHFGLLAEIGYPIWAKAGLSLKF